MAIVTDQKAVSSSPVELFDGIKGWCSITVASGSGTTYIGGPGVTVNNGHDIGNGTGGSISIRLYLDGEAVWAVASAAVVVSWFAAGQ